LQGDQRLRGRLRLLDAAGRRKARVDADIAALRPSKPFEPLAESREPRLHFRIVLAVADQHTDAPHAVGLLCSHHSRPRHRRAAEKRDELPPS
jgi:hypothetical protein